jgi:hypothetical protein
MLAERVGFEPTLEFPLNTLSKRAPSATRPSLRLPIHYSEWRRNTAEGGRLCHTILRTSLRRDIRRLATAA